MSFLKHSSNVYDGSNPSCSFCSFRGEGLESVEVGVEYQASYSFLFGTYVLFLICQLMRWNIYIYGTDHRWFSDLIEYIYVLYLIVGNSGFGTNGDFHCVVRTHERSFVCLCLQPSNASFSCHHGLSATRRKVAPWKVYMHYLFWFYVRIKL